MEKDFIYWRHHTPIGVKVEEISGGADRSGAVWRAMALQVWKENGRDGYRDLDHTEQGAPLLYAEHNRISLTHTQGLLAVATLPPTPECPLEVFAERTALGIDAERADRAQTLKVRERYLGPARRPSTRPLSCRDLIGAGRYACYVCPFRTAKREAPRWKSRVSRSRSCYTRIAAMTSWSPWP